MTIYHNPGKRGLVIPGLGRMDVRSMGGAAAVIPWYLSGGIPAAACVAAYQPKGAASLAASYVNLANPGTNDAAPGVAPTFAAATGWTFNGSSQHLKTGVIPDSSAWSGIVRFSNSTSAGDRFLFGSIKNDAAPKGRFCISPDNGSGNVYYGMSDSLNLFVPPAITEGVLAITGNTAYRNGASDGSIATASHPAQEIYIGVSNVNGGILYGYRACKIQAIAFYNTTITPEQVAAVSAAMAAL